MKLRRVSAVYWVLSVGLAVVTALTIGRMGAAADARADYWGTVAEVPVATGDLPPGSVIEPADIELRSVPEALLPEAVPVADPVGLTTVVGLVAGEVVTEAKVAPTGLVGPAALLAPGQRALAVPVADGVAPPLEIGDRVDVLVTFAVAGPEGVPGGAPTYPIARGATVVHVAEEAVTLAVGLDEAPRLAFSLAQGAVVLALTSAGDDPPSMEAGSASP